MKRTSDDPLIRYLNAEIRDLRERNFRLAAENSRLRWELQRAADAGRPRPSRLFGDTPLVDDARVPR